MYEKSKFTNCTHLVGMYLFVLGFYLLEVFGTAGPLTQNYCHYAILIIPWSKKKYFWKKSNTLSTEFEALYTCKTMYSYGIYLDFWAAEPQELECVSITKSSEFYDNSFRSSMSKCNTFSWKYYLSWCTRWGVCPHKNGSFVVKITERTTW